MIMSLEYIKDAASLSFEPDACTGCGVCMTVCPHGVLAFKPEAPAVTGTASRRRVVEIVYKDRCMECGACMMNCPEGALWVRKGVGCAAAVVASRLAGREEITCGCGGEEGEQTGGSCCGGGGCCG